MGEKEPLESALYNILGCPMCKVNVKYNTNKTKLLCIKCKKEYPIRGNVPIMMIG